jgi:general nucleoside transport system ATP-binding protein
VVIVSSELDEIYALSDRIAVMYEGKIVGFCPPDIPEAELGLMMAGAGAAAAHAEVKELSPEEVAAQALNQGSELQEPEP